VPYREELLEQIASSPSSSYDGSAWRITFPGNEPTRPNIRGARWNPPDVSALYTALTLECAQAEFRHLLSLQPVQPRRGRVESHLTVRLAKVLDLSSFDAVARLGVDLRSLDDTLASHLPCQEIGGAVAFLNYEGLLIPSMRAEGGINLVIYTDNIEAGGISDIVIVETRLVDSFL
jgi:RES domain-containing protein